MAPDSPPNIIPQNAFAALEGPTERPKSGWRRVWQALQHPAVICALQFTLVMGAYLANRRMQVYCQPVLWAAIVLITCFIPVVFWPYLKRIAPPLLPILQILRGIAFCICLYCILFLDMFNLALPLLLLTGIGILGFVPHTFAVLLIYQTFAPLVRAYQRKFFLLGIGFSMLLAVYFVWDFQAAIPIAQQLAAQPQRYEGPHAGSVEWILGMHFKYHTRQLIGIDGWRPPLHDPAGVIGFWGNGLRDPLKDLQLSRLAEREAIFHSAFPDLPMSANCDCGGDDDGMDFVEWISDRF